MVNYSAINNATFEAACALVPAPYGPLTRVDAVAAISPNTHIPIGVTSALSVAFIISYDQMSDPLVRDKILADVHSGTGRNHDLWQAKLWADAIQANLRAYDPPLASNAEAQKIYHAMRMLPSFTMQLPEDDFQELPEHTPMRPAFTETHLLLVSTVVNTTPSPTKAWLWFWDWGDNTFTANSVVQSPPAHTYAAAGTYTIRLVAIGRGGIGEFRKTISVVAS